MKKITKTVDGVQYRRIPTFKNNVHNEMMKELFLGVEDHTQGFDIEVVEENKQRSVITMTLKEDTLKKYKQKEVDDKQDNTKPKKRRSKGPKIEGKDLFE